MAPVRTEQQQHRVHLDENMVAFVSLPFPEFHTGSTKLRIRSENDATIPRRTSQVLCVWMLQIYIKVLPLANTEV